MENNCYKGSKTKLGIHKDLYLSLLNGSGRYKPKLNIESPKNLNEAELLVEFVYGIKLKVEFEHFTNKLKVSGWGFDNKQAQRDIAIARLEGADHLTYVDTWGGKETVRKKAIGRFRWHIGRHVSHRDYSDSQFNKVTLDSSYEIESTVIPQTIFGPRGSGGIGYGDSDIESFSELERIEYMYLNQKEPARPEYIELITKA